MVIRSAINQEIQSKIALGIQMVMTKSIKMSPDLPDLIKNTQNRLNICCLYQFWLNQPSVVNQID